ncbi:AAA family ATPase [Streptomyces sp. NPDC049887]|uniref:helix-turn-helix transcriptional regulator n=1 Tax=unclassified Streptomyces TaxID=2593676 RepID=UPI00343CF1EA
MGTADGRRAREVLEDLFARAREGQGRAALVTGAAGMGKTTLVHDLQDHALGSGARVLTALASRAERDLPMGVVGQLAAAAGAPVDPALLPPGAPAGTDSGTGATLRAIDAFHRLMHGLAEHEALVITVDDAHEMDAASRQCLLYLVRRVGAARILVVLGERADISQPGSAITSEFVRNPRCALVQLGRLSVAATASVLASLPRPRPAPETASLWQRASGGSPLLLRALLDDRTDPAAAEPKAGEAFRLAVRHLLDQLDPVAARTAHGLAVLGDDATAADLDWLLGLPGGTAARAVATLDALGLTEEGRYRVAAVQATALAEPAPEDRAALHRAAARLLYRHRAATDEVARHLVAGGPVDESWALAVLRDTAAQALRTNDPERALTCLRVAHDACSDLRERAQVRAELVQAEWEVDPAAVRVHLPGLVEDHRAGLLGPRQSIRLIAHLLWHGRPEEADALFADLDPVEGRLPEDCQAQLETMRVWFAHSYPVLGARYREHTLLDEAALSRSVGALDPQADGALVLHALMSEGPTGSVLETAERLLQGVVLHDPPVAPTIAALATYVHAARLDRAADWCDLLLREAERRTPVVRAILAAASAAVESRLGNFEVARRRADLALTLVGPTSWGIAIGVPLAAKVLACTSQGDREGAAECFRVPVPDVMFQTLPGLHYLQARGRYHLSVGRYHAALGDFHACRDLMAAWGLDVSASLSWRVYAAEALIELDSPAQARELLAEELARQDDGNGGNPWLRKRSLQLLDRLGNPRPSDSPAAAPGRGTPEERGQEGLSKAEQRVALLASQGCTNREIAARLFVTASTVEQHLTRAYQKLGVRGRTGLPAVLGRVAAGRPADS